MKIFNLFKLNKIERMFAKIADGERVVLIISYEHDKEIAMNRTNPQDVIYLATMVKDDELEYLVTTDNVTFTKSILIDMNGTPGCSVSIEKDN